ncbi:unnamed protein product, partial [Mesorhabditis spiculigera]
MMENDAVGIDFGSFRTKIGIFRAGNYEEILDEKGHPWDSYVTFEPIENFYGCEALQRQGDSLASTIYAWKNLIGCSSEDLTAVLELSTKLFNKTPSSVSTIEIACGGYSFSPDEITTMFFAHIKERIDHLYPPSNCSKNDEAQISKTRRKCVITAPAFLTDTKRQVLKRALEDAGFEILQIVDEPTAAAISYGFSNTAKSTKNVLFLDLGATNFNVGIFALHGNRIVTKAIHGLQRAGGEAFSLPIENDLITRIWAVNGGEKLNIEEEWLVKKAAFEAVEELIRGDECVINYPKAQIAYKLDRHQIEICGTIVPTNDSIAQGASIFAAHLHSTENPKSYSRVHEDPYIRDLELEEAKEPDLIDWSA